MLNEHKQLTGFGIEISSCGVIHIGNFLDGRRATGSYVRIQKDGHELEAGLYIYLPYQDVLTSTYCFFT